MVKILIITGTPGVGKTRLAKTLANRLGWSFLDLGALVRRKKLYTRYDRRDRSYVLDERRVHRSLKQFFDENPHQDLVLEAHTLGPFMPKKAGMKAIVVRLDPVILARRLKARKWPMRKVWENVEAELIDLSVFEAVRFLGKERVCQVDSSGRSIGEVLNKAQRLIAQMKWRAERGPDWLGSYDPIELWKRIL